MVVVPGLAATNVPLASLLPRTPTGCSLLVAPDVLDVAASNGGAVATQLAIPDTLVLVGLHWRQQLILLELDQSLRFLQNTSNNAIALPIGARCVAARAGSVCDGRSRCRRASIR